MLRETTKEGSTVADALDAALEELGVQPDAIEYEVIEEAGKKIFGTARPAVVRVWLTIPDRDLEEEAGEVGEEPMPAELLVEKPELTDEEIDRVADGAVAVITEIVSNFGLSPSIEEYEGDDGEIILDIVGEDLGVLIGRHGRTLDALQILVAAITHRRLDMRYPIMVDVSGYRYRRRLKLEEMAKRAADRVARQGRAVAMRPMTSFERKAVHIALRNDRRVRTESEGDEPYRQVVVHPK